MNKYVIERLIPKIGTLNGQELQAAATRSCKALVALGHNIQWMESFVAADQTYCVYLAQDEEIIRRHAELSGFPANRITQIGKMIDPTTASAL